MGDEETETSPAHTKTKMFNIFLLGLCFCFVFTGFNTMSQTQALVYDSFTNQTNGDFQVKGLVTNGIVYGVFAFASWGAPSVVVAVGPRLSMILAALTYLFNITQYLYLNKYSVYPASVIIGLGAPVIWTAQGTFLSQNSDEKTITRNSGIFWAMNMSSAFIGNMFAYFLFRNEESIEKDTRITLGAVLTAVSTAGILLMFLFRPATWAQKKKEEQPSMLDTLRQSWSLFTTKEMLLFSITLFFTGLSQTMWGGVFAACIGFTGGFGESRKALATLNGVIIASGEVIGGVLFGFLGHLTVKRGRHPIIILGFVISIAAYVLMFINFPQDATLGETEKEGLISPNTGLALFTSFLLGFSDACFNTQVNAILGGVFKEQAASAFGIFKFVQSLASMISFFYSAYIGFYWQLLIIIIFDVLGTAAAVRLELRSRRAVS